MTKYTPLYPFLLSLVWRLDNRFPHNLRWIMLLQAVLWLVFLGTAYRTARLLVKDEDRLAPIALLLAAWAPALVYLSVSIMAEALFAGFALSSIVILESRAQAGKSRSFWAGCAAAAAFLTKTAALPLLIAGLLALAARKRWACTVAYAIPATAAMAGWWTWISTHRWRTEDVNLLYYLDYVEFYKRTASWPDLFLIVNANLSSLLETVGRLIVFTEHDHKWVKLILILVGATACYFTTSYLIRKAPAYVQYFIALFCIQSLLWNYPPNERFLFPLLIFLIVGVLIGTKRLFEKISASSIRKPLWLAWIAVVAGWWGANTVSYLPAFVHTHGARQQRIACFADWARSHIGNESAVLAYRDVDLYLFSGIKGIRLQRVPNAAYRSGGTDVEELLVKASDYARKTQLAYLVWDRSDYYDVPGAAFRERLERILREMRTIRLEAEVCGVRLYRFEHTGPL